MLSEITMNKRPEENYGLVGLPTEVEYLRADRKWLLERNAELGAEIAELKAQIGAMCMESCITQSLICLAANVKFLLENPQRLYREDLPTGEIVWSLRAASGEAGK